MCGRYSSSRNPADLMADFNVETVHGDGAAASWNVAPTQQVWTVLERAPRDSAEAGPKRQLRTARWGLVPSWAKDRAIGSRMINARIETVTEKSAFKAAARKRRCLIPADGYYEWQQHDGSKTKTPWFLRAADGTGLAFAGLYELWPAPELPEDAPDRWLWSLTIITTAATDTLGHIHDRTPLIVPPALHGDWLNPTTTELDDVRAMLAEVPEPHLHPHIVSTAVNNPSNNGPELIRPIEVS
jgi:putative SOS response-associated peptidase YedK